MATLNADQALAILRVIDPDTKLTVSGPPNPFYNNSDRMPRVGDVVSIPAVFKGDEPYRYLYTGHTRHIGYKNQHPTNWVSVRHGSPDTGPVYSKVSERTLICSIPVN